MIGRVGIRGDFGKALEAEVDVDRVRVALEALEVGRPRADAAVGEDALSTIFVAGFTRIVRSE